MGGAKGDTMTIQHKRILASAVIALFGASAAYAQDKPTTEQQSAPAPQAAPASAASDTEKPRVKKAQSKKPRATLTSAERSLVQERLRSQGFYKGKINGRLDGSTKSALMAFQRKNGLAPTGGANEATLSALGIMPSMAAAEPPEPKSEPVANAPVERTGGTEADTTLPDQTVELSSLSVAQTRAIQEKLQRLGFYVGEVNGVAGPSTVRALRDYYQSQAALASQGKVRKETAATMKKRPDIERVRGEDRAPAREKPERTRGVETGLDNSPRSTSDAPSRD
jgi:peptidoglycan hydrolase-like protein with peptidoglycan-binding domain